MNKYFGFAARAVPYLVVKYPQIFKNAVFRNRMSLTLRYNQARNLLTGLNRRLRIEIIPTGLQRLPADPSFVMTPNHQSFMDSLCLIQFMEQQAAFVAKKETKNFILVGKVLTSIDGVYLDRDNLRQEIKLMQEIRTSLKTENKKWVIFPEGTRSKDVDHRVGEFKPGSLKMAMSAGVDIYPVAMWGSFRILNFKENSLKKFPVFIHIFNPITPEMYEGMTTSELAPMIRNMIQEKLEELKVLDVRYCEEHRKKRTR